MEKKLLKKTNMQSDSRTVYYDHEPAYKKLQLSGKNGWFSGGGGNGDKKSRKEYYEFCY